MGEKTRITMRYTNYRGEQSVRNIILSDGPQFVATEHHPEPQWIIRGWDMDKGAYRDFALKDCDFTTAAPVSVKVKPLEWVNHSLPNCMIFNCYTEVGHFVIKQYPAPDDHFQTRGPNWLMSFKTLDEAKAAAQSDYEVRILSALDVTPITLSAALELPEIKAVVSDYESALQRLRDGDHIFYSRDGDDAWFATGDCADIADGICGKLRANGMLKRFTDEDGFVDWDQASDLALAALKSVGGAE